MRNAKGTIHVFTYKDGALSMMAHDLRLSLEQFVITLDDDTVRGEFDLTSLVLDGPVENGIVRPQGCDERMRAEVEQEAQRRILHTEQHPVARFVGHALPNGRGFKVNGELTLAGRTAPVSFDVRDGGGTYRAAIEIQPSRWGIAPYKAMLGAIRLKDLVRIDIAISDG